MNRDEYAAHMYANGVDMTKVYICPHCEWTSHNPFDARYKYCDHCHKFEDECR